MNTQNSQSSPGIDSFFDQSLVTILVSSCDRYSDLWLPFFNLYKRFFPAATRIFLINEKKSFDFENVVSLKLGGDKDWSSLLVEALENVSTEYVLFTLEDFFIYKPVDLIKLGSLIELMNGHKLNMIRLVRRPGSNIPSHISSKLMSIPPGADYRVSTQVALWKVSILKSILKNGESAWEFEINGTKRAMKYVGFFCVSTDAFPYKHHVVERGKWFPWSAYYYSRMKIGVDLNSRSVMSLFECIVWFAKKIVGTLKNKIKSNKI